MQTFAHRFQVELVTIRESSPIGVDDDSNSYLMGKTRVMKYGALPAKRDLECDCYSGFIDYAERTCNSSRAGDSLRLFNGFFSKIV